MQISRLFFFVTIITLLSACDKNVVFEKNVKIPESQWDINNPIRLDAEIKDTLTPFNMYVNLRNGSRYQYSNLFLFFTTTTPGGIIAHDTIEVTLADDRGKWLGNGIGDIKDNRILFKRNFHFPRTGIYKFELQQAMRVNPLLQIADVGIRIEKAQ